MRWLPAIALLLAASGADAAPLGSPRPVQLAQYADPARTAELAARVGQLEEELRRLTGRIEELEHEGRDTQARMERLLADVDARLGQVEQAGRPAAPQAALPQDEPPPRVAARVEPPPPLVPSRPSPPPVPGPGAQPPGIEPDAAAAKGYVLGTIPQGAARNPPVPNPQLAARPPVGTGYEGAVNLLQGGRYDEAEQAFKDFVEKSPNDPRASSASYWLAETYYFRKDYGNAAATFARNYRTYGPTAPKAPDNLLKLGMSLAALGDKEKACQSFDELTKRHPDAPAPIRQALGRERGNAGCGRG